MKPEAQRIAIAEACGIKNIQKGGYCYIPEGQEFARSKQVPDYLNDLNAMNEAEKALTEARRQIYWETLERMQGALATYFDGMHATADQRAEAFLRTLGLWKDDACPKSDRSTTAST